jgi:hypothetical protein
LDHDLKAARVHRSPLLRAFAVAALLLTLAACGGGKKDPSEAEIKADLSGSFQQGDDPLSEEQADCYADVIIDEVGVDRLKDVDFAAETPPKEIKDDVAAATVRALDECDLTTG